MTQNIIACGHVRTASAPMFPHSRAYSDLTRSSPPTLESPSLANEHDVSFPALPSCDVRTLAPQRGRH